MKLFLDFTAKKALTRLSLPYFLVLFFFASTTCSVSGQVAQKKHLTSEDYRLWSQLDLRALAPKGDWLSYQLKYEDNDTLFVKRVVGDKTYHYPKGFNGQFYNREYFVCQGAGQTLLLTDLNSGKQQCITDVVSYEMAGRTLLVLRQQEGQSRMLYSYDANGEIKKLIGDVQAYKVSPDNKSVAYFTVSHKTYTTGIILLTNRKETTIATNTIGPYQQLKWSNDGKQLVFLQQEEHNYRLNYYSIPDNKRYEFQPSEYTLPDGMLIVNSSLQLSRDGQQLFFKIKQQPVETIQTTENEVQVWNAADKWLYPAEKAIDGWNKVAKIAVWEPRIHYFSQLTDNLQPQGILTSNQRYIITYNKQDFEPQFKFQADRKLYITDVRTGVRKLWLEVQSGVPYHLVLSPNGKYICYFKQGKWYNYDIAKDIHYDLTQILAVPLDNCNHDMPDEASSYGNPGWTTDEKSVLLYDQYDLWEVSPDGLKAVRLTKGREKEIIYRLVPLKPEQLTVGASDHFNAGLFDLSKRLLLSSKALDCSASGYSFWKKGKIDKTLVYTNKKVNGLMKAIANETFIWTEQNFESPPQIKVKKEKEKVVSVLESNSQQQKYFWGKAMLISYVNSIGKHLKGTLFYPADYQQGTHYPMIVHVYERQSQYFNEYRTPSLYNSDGFNVSNLTTRGYFVLMPDISYEIGKVGFSALDCVTAAVKTVLDMGVVDEKKIGIIGHSFGGFETDFIITQTNMFSAAVAGAAITDNVSNYLSIARNTNHPNYFRIESFQSRMGKSLFEDKKRYLDNSPVLLAASITTPLLSWTGLRDLHIDTSQTFEFYLAMRRLGKRHIMLAYPDEEHAMEKKENDADLTNRVQMWFDYYLKGLPPAQWMKKK